MRAEACHARTAATNPAVKEFGQRMVTDHTKLDAKMKPYADNWGVAAPTGLSPDAQKEYDKLQGMSGNDFDKEYISDMVSDHSKDLDAFNKEPVDGESPRRRVEVITARVED